MKLPHEILTKEEYEKVSECLTQLHEDIANICLSIAEPMYQEMYAIVKDSMELQSEIIQFAEVFRKAQPDAGESFDWILAVAEYVAAIDQFVLDAQEMPDSDELLSLAEQAIKEHTYK